MRECDANGVGLSTEYDERGMIDRQPKPERVRDTGEKKKKREFRISRKTPNTWGERSAISRRMC